jgi:antitoxin VapB
MTQIAKVFQNGRSQAVRLPKECRVNCDEVYIEKVGDSLIITPMQKSKWDIMRSALNEMEGLEIERHQLPLQERELF